MSHSDVTHEDDAVSTAAFLTDTDDEGTAPSTETAPKESEADGIDPDPKGKDIDPDAGEGEKEAESKPDPPEKEEKADEALADSIEAILAEMNEFRRMPVPGAPVPTSGVFRQLDLKLWQKGFPGYPDFVVPQMGKKEAAIYRDKLAKEEALRRELLKLAATVSVIITVLNSKGGAGKTPAACYMATILNWAIEKMIILVDANEMDGTTCDLMNISRHDTKAIRWGMDNLDKLGDYDSVTDVLACPPQRGNAVHVMASDPSNSDQFTQREFIQLLWTLKKQCKALINDCGQGHNNTHHAVGGAATAASHMVFSAMTGNPDSFNRVISTMAAQMGFGFENKVKNGFIVVNAAGPNDTKDQFMKQLTASARRMTRKDVPKEVREKLDVPEGGLDLEFFNIKPERVYVIPYDQYIKDLRPAHAQSLHIDTRIAYLELLVGIYRQKAEVPDLSRFLLAA